VGKQSRQTDPAFLGLAGTAEEGRRLEAARAMSRNCVLCPRRCEVDRTSGSRGFCNVGPRASVARFLPHFGEEPPISGASGAGTIFVEGCTLRCVYCQNHQISRGGTGPGLEAEKLAVMMLDLQAAGCHNVEWVSPTQSVPALVQALFLAAGGGLRLPVVYNSGGYDSLEALALLDGLVDVYLPDMKYSNPQTALRLSGAADYVEANRQAVAEMFRQAGPPRLDGGGLLRRGLIVRHLVLPGLLHETYEVLAWLAEEISPAAGLSIMSQYVPLAGRSSSDGGAGTAPAGPERRLTPEEYRTCLQWVERLGFEQVWAQSMPDPGETDRYLPDFSREEPFGFFPASTIPGSK
jgi:putative pyruvate formate lyase activating enzyme